MPGRPRLSAAIAAGCALALVSPATATQAATLAAKAATTHLHVSVAPATAKVATTVSVTGTVSPKGGTVTLQRLVGKKWVGLTHVKASRTGAFALAFHAPKSTTTLALRVVRPASAHAKAGVSPTLHVHVVKTAYSVSATPSSTTLTTPAPLTVSGKVAPKGTGSVTVQRLVRTTWVTLGKAALSKSSTFTFSKALPPGSYRLRVSKPFSSKVAGGVSKSFAVVVRTPPVLPNTPLVVTTALPAMTAGRPMTATLAATGGTAPYSWAVVAGTLPSGLILLPSGAISGAPTVVGVGSFTARVTDALGQSATGVVTTTVGPVVVRAWGSNGAGQAGNGTTTPTNTITTAALPGNVKAISVGFSYGLALLTDGSVYAWGANNAGQLGLGDMNDRSTPVLVPGLSHVVSIAAGFESSYAVTASGLLYSWGANESGELGDGTTTPTMSPHLVTAVANLVAVAAGSQYALALFASGRVDTWGNGTFGTLGDGTETPQQKTPVTIPTLSRVTAIAAGQVAAYAVLDDGSVKAWGLKEHGQLGNTAPPDPGLYEPTPVPVTGLTGVVSLACNGFEFCLAARSDGTVAAWGYGNDGEMGNGTINDNLTAAAVPGLTSVVQVAVAHQTGYAVRSDGTLLSWGYDPDNELGTGDPSHTATPSPAVVPALSGVFSVAAGSQTAFAFTTG